MKQLEELGYSTCRAAATMMVVVMSRLAPWPPRVAMKSVLVWLMLPPPPLSTDPMAWSATSAGVIMFTATAGALGYMRHGPAAGVLGDGFVGYACLPAAACLAVGADAGRIGPALAAFEGLVAYEVGEVTAAATFYIGEIYFIHYKYPVVTVEIFDSKKPCDII